jgi:hypothetical protein
MAVLIPSVSLAGGELQIALGLIQQTQALGLGVGSDHVLHALQAMERVPGAIANDQAARVRELVRAGAPQEAFRVLDAHRPLLEAAAEQCRVPLAEARDLPLERIAAALGLPSEDFRPERMVPRERPPSPAPPLVPAEARAAGLVFNGRKAREFLLIPDGGQAGSPLVLRVGRVQGEGRVVIDDRNVSADHAEIRFSNGHYWLEDRGSTNGTFHQGRRLGRYERVALAHGDRIQIGRREIVLKLPYERRLALLAERLKDAPSVPAVLETLEREGFGDVVPKVREILSSAASVEERLENLRREIPHDAGLLIKLESLMLRREAVLLRALYFPQARLEEALTLGERLARSLAQAVSFPDLAERLGRTNAEGFRDAVARLTRLSSRREAVFAFAEIPRTFGLREQARRLFLEGLSLGDGQKRDLQYRGVTPDILAERPWRRIKVPPLLKEALEPFEALAAQRLGLDGMEMSVEGLYAEEGEAPSVNKVGVTAFLLYDEYQAKNPTPSQLLHSQTGSSRPEFFEQVEQNLRRDGVPVYAAGYWFYGGTFDPATRFEGRVYLSLRRRHAEAIYRTLSGTVEPAVKAVGGQIQFKIAARPDEYGRSDSGVIYFHAKDQETVYRAVREMHRAHPEFFKDGHPLFTMPLRDETGRALTGLSFGEHPESSGVSFGSLRTGAMTTGIRTARALMKTAEPPDWAEMQQIFAYFLQCAGVEVENPAFNAGGRERFGPLLRLSGAPLRTPEQAPAAVDPAVAVNLIASELLQRYPALRGEEFRTLVERMARDIFKAWRGGGWVPEDVFEARVAAAIDLMRRQNGPRTGALAEEMIKTDQGPRAVRAVAARLRSEIPLLGEEVFAKLVRAIANNVNKAWLAGDRTGEAFERVYQDYLRRLPAWIEAMGPQSEPLRRLLAELRRRLPHS